MDLDAVTREEEPPLESQMSAAWNDGGDSSEDAREFDAGIDSSPAEPGPHERLWLHRQFQSRTLPDSRDLVVYVPPGYYQDESRYYAVMYLHDGQNLFDPETSFIKGRNWMVREAADAAIESGEMEPAVIVGIYNTGDRRLAEYTHERDWQMGGGEADRYGELIVHELMPWIADRYRIKAGREHTGLGGSSLGGLVSLYLGLKYAEVFGRLAVMSPSVWWNHKSILGVVSELSEHLRHRPRIWLDAGEREGRLMVRDADLLAKRLRACGWREGEDLRYTRVEGGKHDEESWAARVGPMLRFLFPA